MPRPDLFAVLNPNSVEGHTPLDSFSRALEDDVDDAITESEPDAEEEIDQLDSDSDTPADQPQDAPAPKKPPQSRSGERRPGQTLLPTVRIENILQAEGLLGNLSLSKEGIFLISVATEEFIRRLVKAGHQRASQQNRNMVRYHDMASVARDQYEFNFLQETIPTPRTLYSAFHLRTERERELLKDDPAMQFQDGRTQPQRPPSPQAVVVNGRHTMPVEPSPPPDLASTSGSSTKPKSRLCTGVPSVRKPQHRVSTPSHNPSSTSAGKRPITEPSETWEEWREKSRRLYGTGDVSRLRNSQPSSNSSNGTSSHTTPLARDSSDVPPLTPDPQWDGPDPAPREGIVQHRGPHSSLPKHLPPPPPRLFLQPFDEPPPVGPLTGPGSAFLQGPGGPFPRPSPPSSVPSVPATGSSSSVAPASPPGRTIFATDNHLVKNDD